MHLYVCVSSNRLPENNGLVNLCAQMRTKEPKLYGTKFSDAFHRRESAIGVAAPMSYLSIAIFCLFCCRLCMTHSLVALYQIQRQRDARAEFSTMLIYKKWKCRNLLLPNDFGYPNSRYSVHGSPFFSFLLCNRSFSCFYFSPLSSFALSVHIFFVCFCSSLHFTFSFRTLLIRFQFLVEL